MRVGHGYANRMEAMCQHLNIVITDEMREFWAQVEQHNIDIHFREIADGVDP
jgi:hypothetical protein